MPNNNRNINYATLLYEALRNYFSINAAGQVSILYKYLAAIIAPLQAPFDAFDIFRKKENIIASCKWQIGQLTNVLNYLFDNPLSRIFITQSVVTPVSDPTFAYPPDNFDMTFADSPPEIFEVEFTDKTLQTVVTIHVPVSANLAEITAAVNQIRMQGIPYNIVTF